jgi:hypothetical protein
MSKMLGVIALAMLVLVGAMGLKTAVAGNSNGSVLVANGGAPAPPTPWKNGGAPAPPTPWKNGGAPAPPTPWKNGGAPAPPTPWK